MLWRSVVDDLADVLLELSARRGRAVLLMLAVALSTGALVAAVGVSTTASEQINADMAAQVLDEITLTAAETSSEVDAADRSGAAGPVFTAGAEARVHELDMVAAAGLRLDLDVVDSRPSRFEVPETEQSASAAVQVFGATESYLDAVSATVPGGTAWMVSSESPYQVVLLGEGAAQELGVPTGGDLSGYRVWVNGHAAEVVGIVTSGDRVDLSRAVIVPYAEAVARRGDSQSRMTVRTELGGGGAVAEVVRLAARPDAPEKLVATRIVDLRDLRTGVQTQLGRMAGTVGTLLLLLTGLLIANSMVVAVVSRTSEIGLRRALGASRADVARLFLLEGGSLGLLGGLAGGALGAWVVVAVSAVNGWGAVLTGWLAVAGPTIGVAIGVVASLYPSVRAAGISPATAIRVD